MSKASGPFRSAVSRSALAVLVLAASAACGSADAPEVRTGVRDSAGVALVQTTGEDRPLAWRAERVHIVPALDEEGDGFFSVSALAVVPGRRIAVMDRDGHRVVLLDEEGSFLARAGRQGEGPGEFQYPIRLFAHADGGVSVFDMMNARIETFDPDLRHVRSEPVGGLAYYGGEITDLGDVLILSASDPAVPATDRVLAVSTTDTIEIVRTSRETGGVVTLESCGMSFSGMPPLFSPGTRWTAGPDRAVFVAVTAGYDIDVYEPPTFALARRIHRPVP
ncbi:MAG TPA: hypothetical protein VK858_04380, partial [Longimicrobiales bacterium]|nr:hypothetical protein [Longimicrobiales bacterium]